MGFSEEVVLSPSLQADLKGGLEKKCYLWYRVAILAFLVFPLLRIPIPQEFIINSVALL